jgi:hypothetical protein
MTVWAATVWAATAWAALALVAGPAPAMSHLGLIEREDHAGTVVLHRAVCARDTRPGHMHCHAHVVVHANGTPAAAPRPTRSGASWLVPSGYGPADLRNAYRIAAKGSATTIVAVVDAYGYPGAQTDLAAYRATYGLPPCTAASGCFIRVNQRGGSAPPPTDTGWSQEQALDIQMASAMCPNCRILLVETDDDTIDNLAAGVTLAAARGAAAISNSYGGSEPGTRAYAQVYKRPGIAMTASAGDTGYGAEFPASAPYMIPVGGTRLVRAANARGWKETVWTQTGSGCSAIYAKPAWQTDALCTKRMMNDVAAVAAPATGVAVYGPIGPGGTSGWMVFGGTSVGAPLIAGIYAAAGTRPLGARSIWRHRAELYDVTSGNNGACGNTYFCTAETGYDGPAGNGTPKGKAAF